MINDPILFGSNPQLKLRKAFFNRLRVLKAYTLCTAHNVCRVSTSEVRESTNWNVIKTKKTVLILQHFQLDAAEFLDMELANLSA